MENQVIIAELSSEYFGVTARETDKNTRIIVASFDQNEVGMIVDEVSEVLTVPTKEQSEIPALVTDPAC